MIPQLPDNASIEQIQASLNLFKIKATNILVNQITHSDARFLDCNELKKLTDTVLVIEDSFKGGDEEGKAARAMQRLIEKYGDDSYNSEYVPAIDVITLDNK